MSVRSKRDILSPAVICFREDLRLSDHPALAAAAESGRPLLCVFILDDETPALHALGAASKWWLHGALADLRSSLERQGGSLLVLSGSVEKLLPLLVEEVGAKDVYWHERHHAMEREQDRRISEALEKKGVSVHERWGTVLLDPKQVQTKDGGFYKVFTSFWKSLQTHEIPEPVEAPHRPSFHDFSEDLLKTHRLEEKTLLPSRPDWAGGLRSDWEPGETEAQEHLRDFLKHECKSYGKGRDEVSREGTSRLSPYLASGAISPRQVWKAVQDMGAQDEGARIFLSEIGWRDFAKYTLHHQPDLPKQSLTEKFRTMSWRKNEDDLMAWKRGQTGVPIVDAGMRQLWQTGWMHNRARMIVGSFLTKHLLLDWRDGEAWFRDTLVDADWASNALNWQWVAGTGVDASPFFRVFNPTRQAEKFDPDGDYIRQWVPELKALSGKTIFEPWTATVFELEKADVRLGKTYPHPIVDLKEGRDRAMSAFRSL